MSAGSGPSSSPSSSCSPSLDSLKQLASEVGHKVSSVSHSAKVAIEKKLHEVTEMIPVIDLTHHEDEPHPSAARPPEVIQLWPCPFCTYASNTPDTQTCAVCLRNRAATATFQSPSVICMPVVNGEGSRRKKAEASRQEENASGIHLSRSTGSLYPQLSQKEPPSQQDTPAWTCSRCTLVNTGTTSKCVACENPKESKKAKKPEPLERRPSVEQGWTCVKCTFVNPTSGNVCLMCSTPKEGTLSPAKPETYEGEDVEYLRKLHEQEALQQWQEIVKFCRQDRNPFVDDRFPPTNASLSVCKPSDEFAKVQSWLRPSHLRLSPGHRGGSGETWTVCRTPLASDINQGILGDCWFLCSLSVVAERPELIYNVLMTRDYNREGAYLIRLCIDGLWKVILVDDLFPVDGHGNLAFSEAGRRQLWVPLIEKALAKAHGSYYAIEGGFVNEGLMFLTGAPCDRINLEVTAEDDLDSIWVRLLSSHSAKYLMGASCGKMNQSLNEQECMNLGLRPRHSYSVLDVTDVDGLRLVRLRDPWGRQGWKGDWSDRSTLWTQALRQKLLPHGGAEGLFWISLIDFVKYFESVDVSKYRKHWKEIRVQGKFPNGASHKLWYVWSLTVSETTEVDFTLYQQGYRGASTEMNHHHLDLAILIFSMSSTGKVLKLVAATKRTAFSFVGESALLDPGHYVVWTLAFNHWSDMILPEETFPKNVLAIHSAKTVVIEKLPTPRFALADALIAWSLAKGKSEYNGDGVVVYSVMSGGLVLVYENRYRNHSIQLVCDCTKSREVVSTRGVLLTVDLIPPLSRYVICVLSPSHGSSFYIHYLTKQRVVHAWEGLGDWGPVGMRHFPDTDTDLLRDLHSPRPL